MGRFWVDENTHICIERVNALADGLARGQNDDRVLHAVFAVVAVPQMILLKMRQMFFAVTTRRGAVHAEHSETRVLSFFFWKLGVDDSAKRFAEELFVDKGIDACVAAAIDGCVKGENAGIACL